LSAHLTRKCHHGLDDERVGAGLTSVRSPGADGLRRRQQSNFPKTAVFSHIESRRTIWLLPEGIAISPAICPTRKRSSFWRRRVFRTRPVRRKSWRNRLEIETKLYIVEERSYRAPRHGTFVAKRMGATAPRWPAVTSPCVSSDV